MNLGHRVSCQKWELFCIAAQELGVESFWPEMGISPYFGPGTWDTGTWDAEFLV